MKVVIAALLGYINARDTTPVWSLKSVIDHRDDQAFQKVYGDFSTSQANARPPYRSHMMTGVESESDDDSSSDMQMESSDHSGEFFTSAESGREAHGGYERAITSHFSADSDDIFMRSMIKTYALEGKNKDGSPSGAFFLDQAGARAAASEVLATHKGLKGAALQNYLKTYFAKAWSHFDVNQTGKVEVIAMPRFMRFLASDQYMSLGE